MTYSAAEGGDGPSLQCYNADAIARYYWARPWKLLLRALAIVWCLGGFALRLQLDNWRGTFEANRYKRAIDLRETLTFLGPTFIKIGQALSTRPDLVRQDFIEELIELQDKLPPCDSEIAFAILERQLGDSVDFLYQTISPEPVAAASLGQVYRARLHTGEEVAVKVQRPYLRSRLALDLCLIRWGATWVADWLPLNLGHDLTAIVDEFGIKLFEEIDYLNEGRNAEKFAANFHDDLRVKVPKIYWSHTNTKVLTLEWIEGYKLTDTERIRGAGLDETALIEIGVSTGLRQLFEFGFFHADPHPGNLFAMPDGRMAYIDFGMMDQLERETKETLATSVVQLLNRDYNALAKTFVRLGFLAPGVDINPIVPALERVLGQSMGQKVRDFNFQTITTDFSDLMYQYPFRVPANFALIIRSLVTQEGLALTLDPDFKIVDVAYPYISRRLLQGESPEMRRRLVEVLFKGGRFQWERLENMIEIARADRDFDLLPTARLGLQYLFSPEGEYLRHRLLLALTEDDRLHAEEVSRLWELVKDEIEPGRLLGMAFASLREFSLPEAA